MNAEFIKALDALQEEKNIDKEELIEAIEQSIESAYKKNYGGAQEVDAILDRDTGEIKVFANWNVVDEVENPETDMLLEDALAIDPEAKVGSTCRVEVAPKDFGRIAAQNAKQLIFQKIKEAERNIIYNEFLEKQDEIVSGIITRVDRGLVYVDVGNGEAVLLPSEQVPGEVYRQNRRMKVYMLMVKKTTKGPQINVSRTHPGLVKRLFEEEVPEIYDGVVDIVGIAREAGSRTKIAMKANDPAVDPVGSCVGHKGVRVQSIINELGGEKIDVIKYDEDIKEYIANALSPAKVIEVLPKKSEKMALAIVDDFQFSLAIGKEGQNVRLAAKLTGWKIDIKSASDFEKMLAENPALRDDFQGEQEDILADIAGDLDDVLNIEIDDDIIDDLDDVLKDDDNDDDDSDLL
jgi:N utilization substance protein A